MINKLLFAALVPIALASCSASSGSETSQSPATTTQESVGSDVVAAHTVSMKVTGMT